MHRINYYLKSKFSLTTMVIFFIAGGANHFINPEFYLPLIPPYIPFAKTIINFISGFTEILLGIGLIFNTTRKTASYFTILMLLAFIPAHIYFIKMGSCLGDDLCVSEWIGWLRLLIIHPFLLYWVWMVGKCSDNIVDSIKNDKAN